MSSIFQIGSPQFGIRDCKIATNNLNGTFSTAIDVPSIQLLRTTVNTVSAELEGDDIITATHAKPISAQIVFRFGSIDLRVLNIITGKAYSSSGSTPNIVNRVKYGQDNYPYFAICGKAEAVEGGGDTHIFIPKVKIMEGFELVMEYGNFSIPELTCMGVYDPDYTAIVEVIMHETAAAVAIPPV